MYKKKPDDSTYVVASTDIMYRRLRSRKSSENDEDNNKSKSESDAEAGTVDVLWKKVQESGSRHKPDRELCTIYKVPADIRRPNSRVYLPTTVSVGPFHYNYGRREPQFSEMQGFKWRCLWFLLHRNRDREADPKGLLDQCLEAMKSVVAKAQSCYSRVIEMESNEFVEMLVLDGCFLLHLLLLQQHQSPESEYSDEMPRVEKSWMWSRVVYDLLLLENQLPFFVIQQLFEVLKLTEEAQVSLPDSALRLFCGLNPARNPDFVAKPELTVHHLLHLYYLSILPSPSKREVSATDDWILSPKHLKRVGITFKLKKPSKWNSFLDISFQKGAIEIPQMQISDYSASLFGNLIAFEQCFPDTKGHVTTYCAFMDWAVSSTREIGVEQLDNVVINRLRTDRNVGVFFAGLCSSCVSTWGGCGGYNYLEDLFVKVGRYKGSMRRRWIGWLVGDEMDGKAVIGMLAAAAVVALMFVQTFVSVHRFLYSSYD